MTYPDLQQTYTQNLDQKLKTILETIIEYLLNTINYIQSNCKKYLFNY